LYHEPRIRLTDALAFSLSPFGVLALDRLEQVGDPLADLFG